MKPSAWKSRLSARLSTAVGALVAAGLALAPQAAHACAVCMAATQEDARRAFILTTGFMTFLPLAMLGGCVWWLRRRARALAAPVLVETPPASVPARAISRSSSSL